MKHLNSLFATSLLSAAFFAAGTGAQAQVFKKLSVDNLPTTHRGMPTFVDVNNDGYMDLYLCGQRCDGNNETVGEGDDAVEQHVVVPELGNWWVFGSLMVNQGNGQFAYPTLSFGDRMDSFGLPPSLWNTTRWFDFDNDGNMDYISMGCCDGWGFDINEEYDKRYVLLFKNGGADKGYVFEQVANNGNIPQGYNEGDGKARNKSNFSFADYDHDGLTDIVAQMYYKVKEGDETTVSVRKVVLLRNNGDGTFSEMNVFEPIPYAQNPNPKNLFTIEEGDPDDPESETTYTPIKCMRPMTGGAVTFADLNNDGYADIITVGWADGDNNLSGSNLTIYKNNQDGTFSEVDLTAQNFPGVTNGTIAVADFNNDGWLDFALTGEIYSQEQQWVKTAELYINAGDGEFTFARSTADEGNGMVAANESVMAAIDIDHDGMVDLLYTGWSPVKGNWATVLLKGSETGFTEETSVGDIQTGGLDSGSFSFGHFTSKTSLDLVTTGYYGPYGTSTDIFSNVYDADEVEIPAAPTDVNTSYADGKLTVTWKGEDNGNGVGYNVYVKNKATGWLSMIIPADTETGQLKTLQELQTTLRSDDHSEMSYTLNIADADYEVGVSAVNPDAVASVFTKKDHAVANGIKTVDQSAGDIKVTVADRTITVQGADGQAVNVYNAEGQLVAAGVANAPVAVNVSGLYLVKVNGTAKKVTVK